MQVDLEAKHKWKSVFWSKQYEQQIGEDPAD